MNATYPAAAGLEIETRKIKVLVATAVLIAANALVDWKTQSNVVREAAYVFPILVVGYYLTRWQILSVAVVCAFLRESLGAYASQPDTVARFAMMSGAYFGVGLFVRELAVARRLAVEQSLLRQEAEQQLRIMIDSSPAAILIFDSAGNVLQANEAAHRLLDFEPGELSGCPVTALLPALAAVPQADRWRRFFRTTMECTGKKRNGEVFLAHVCFSTYQTHSGPRLAAIVWDTSEELRDREGLVLQSSQATSRILVGAVYHEIRNLCAAVGAAYNNLNRRPELRDDHDFKALGTLATGLEKLAASELRLASDQPPATVDLSTVLDELRIIISPLFSDSGVELDWRLDGELPLVLADHHALLQVFLNLSQNSLRAMRDCTTRRLEIATAGEGETVTVRFRDTGPGVPVPARLFQPFQKGAAATGLGLYVSQAMVRSFGGDLRYEPQPAGSCFAVQLRAAQIPVSNRP